MAVSTFDPVLPPPSVAAVPEDFIARLSVEQYHEMIAAGILQAGDPIELLNGWLVYKMTKNPPHQVANGLVRDALTSLVPKGWFVESQAAITLADSEPEPDVAVIRGKLRDYLKRHPGAQDVALVVEISDSTLERDRGIKQRVYARAGIPIYWIVNLVEHQIEIFSKPSGTGEKAHYRDRKVYYPSDTISIVIQNVGVGEVRGSDLLP